jgi:hypothetical protein
MQHFIHDVKTNNMATESERSEVKIESWAEDEATDAANLSYNRFHSTISENYLIKFRRLVFAFHV